MLRWHAMVGIIALLAAAGSTGAQDYPSRPIRLVVPFAAGGGSDFVGRLIAQKLSETLGQNVVVDNRSGAAALVGTELVARAAADGYTLLLGDSSLTINAVFYKNAKYDALKDFAPVSVIAETPYILVVNPSLPYAGSARDFVAAAKSQPNKINIGSAGNGSGTHLSGELFRLSAGIELTHVPYKSVGPAIADVMAGQIQATMTSAAPVLPLAKAGRLKMLAAASEKRSALLPDLPTLAENGIPDVYVTNWYSIVAVAGTPQPVLKRLYDEVTRGLASTDLRTRLTNAALEPAPTTPEQFRSRITEELKRWAKVMKDAGIKQE